MSYLKWSNSQKQKVEWWSPGAGGRRKGSSYWLGAVSVLYNESPLYCTTMNICHTTVRHIYLKMAKMVNFVVPIFDHSEKNGNDDNDNKVLLKSNPCPSFTLWGASWRAGVGTLVCKVYSSIHYLALDKHLLLSALECGPCSLLCPQELEHSDGW